MNTAPTRAAANPAAFLRRYAAWSLDMALLLAAALVLCGARVREAAGRVTGAFDAVARSMAQAMAELLQGMTPMQLARHWLADPHQRAAIAALSDALVDVTLAPLLLAALLSLAWFTAFEASHRQATPGKHLLGLRVVDAGGAGIGPLRAFARQSSGALSWLTLNIGHLLALVPPQRQALHDRIARAFVVQGLDADTRLPGWAVAWLSLQVVATLAATAWLLVAMQQAMQRAFDALL